MLSLKEEQSAMRERWADPAYRWEHDSELRKRFVKEFRDRHEPQVPSSMQSTGREAEEGTREKGEG